MDDKFDEDDDQITWDVFESMISGDDMLDYFKAINVDASEAKGLFEILDTDHSGGVDCSEIVNGLLRLRGNAGALEMALLLREVSYLGERIDAALMSRLGQLFCKEEKGVRDCQSQDEDDQDD